MGGMAKLLDGRIKPRHLSCFIAAARLNSVVRAAETLNISQPAASKTIAELEFIVGASLFERRHRGLVLTKKGELFLRYAEASVATLRQGLDAVTGAGERIDVRIGALPTASARILPRALQIFTQSGIAATARVITGPNAYLLSLLRSGDVDLVIGRMAEPAEIAGLSFEHLYSEKIAFVVGPSHPLLSVPDFTLSMIGHYPVLMPPPGAVILPTVERLLARYGDFAMPNLVETVSDSFARGFLRLVDAVWIISEGVVAGDVEDGYLRLLPVDTGQTLGSVGLTTPANATLSPPALYLLDCIRGVVAS